MPKFRVVTTEQHTYECEYVVEAATEEEAFSAVKKGDVAIAEQTLIEQQPGEEIIALLRVDLTFKGFVSDTEQRVERWCFSQFELLAISKGDIGFARDDEVFEAWSADPCVIVKRRRADGRATNRYADGTAGVTPEDVLAAQECETPYHCADDTRNAEWRDVLCDADGNFIRLFTYSLHT